MVRSVKRCLKKTLLGARMAFEELETVLREIKLIVNNRPLTFTYEIIDDLLIPSDLMHVRRFNTLSSNNRSKEHTHFQDRFQYWNKEYLI